MRWNLLYSSVQLRKTADLGDKSLQRFVVTINSALPHCNLIHCYGKHIDCSCFMIDLKNANRSFTWTCHGQDRNGNWFLSLDIDEPAANFWFGVHEILFLPLWVDHQGSSCSRHKREKATVSFSVCLFFSLYTHRKTLGPLNSSACLLIIKLLQRTLLCVPPYISVLY